MDVGASAAFTTEPRDKKMSKVPIRASNLFSNWFIGMVLLFGGLLFAAVTTTYFVGRYSLYWSDDEAVFLEQGLPCVQTMVFIAWMIAHCLLAQSLRVTNQSTFVKGFFSNIVMTIWTVVAIGVALVFPQVDFLRDAFGLAEITGVESHTALIVATCLPLGMFVGLELGKTIWNAMYGAADQKKDLSGAHSSSERHGDDDKKSSSAARRAGRSAS